MANYCCTVRTNYFHVKDAEAFRVFMARIYGSEDSIELFEEKDSGGNPIFGFGTYGGISGLRNSEDDEDADADETAYDEFIAGLQTHIADDDAAIILEAGHEKLRYIVGSATVVTCQDVAYLDITHLAVDRSKEMLKNPGWNTKCEY